MKDVAEHAGVSRQLVSMVFRDLSGPKRETRERVMKSARALGYHPDASARSLRQRRSYQIGVLYTMHQPFEVDLVEHLFIAAKNAGYSLVLAPLSQGRTHEVAITEVMQQRIEALVVLATDDGTSTSAGLDGRLPTVQLNGPRATFDTDDVRVDNAGGMRLAVAHLVGLGHTDIVHVDGGDGPNAEERREGYRQAMADADLAGHADLVPSAYSEEDGAAAAAALLAREAMPTAVICCNDRCAFGLVEALVRTGIRIPEQLSVVGYDDSSIASLSFLQLTSVRHDPDALAELAIASVVHRLSGMQQDPPARSLVAAELVVRGTTARARVRG
jgi:DNA-binding LacI/PurR family transcriptional regulator